MSKRIHLLLAPKERFEPEGAGAFALNVLESSRVSGFRNGITVFGSPVDNPFPGIGFQSLATAHWWEGDRNKVMARRYSALVRNERPALVEVYNRPIMVGVLRRAIDDVPIMVHFGNDPRGMDGSRSVAERNRLMEKSAAIVCVSDYIRRCFLEGLDSTGSQVRVIHTGVARSPEYPTKELRIVYIGRIVPEKGVLELVQALVHVLSRHPEWRADIVGARWFGAGERPTPYERSVAEAAARCEQVKLQGFKPHEQVLASLRRASIAVVPSLWDDPFPRTALEALAQGCALICSTRGGLPEIGADRALYLDAISAQTLSDALEKMMTNDTERLALQRRGWQDFPFDIHRTTSALDELRETLMSPE